MGVMGHGATWERGTGEGGKATESLTSFHLCLGIFSTPVTGSINTSFATLVSGTHMAHRRWTQSPWTVCLNAPPSLGQRMHETGFSGETVHLRQSHWPSGM
jgi:hypothetical protein